MHPALALIGLIFAILVVFFIFYYVIHHGFKLTNLGRIGSAAIISLGALLDQINALPWGTILSDAEAKMVGFSVALGLALLHVMDTVKADMMAPAAPVVVPPVPTPAPVPPVPPVAQ